MKHLQLSIVPFLVGVTLLGTTANGQVSSEPDPVPVPIPTCGAFIRKHAYPEIQGHNDGGTCSNSQVHYKYQRTITEYIYERGSKFYCSVWLYQNACYPTAHEFAACPTHTCSNPEPEPESPCCGS